MTNAITIWIICPAMLAVLVGGAISSAQAQVVNFEGTIVPACVLTPTDGNMAINASGTVVGSEESGGTAASLSVASTGGTATVAFSAPTLAAKPVAYTRTPTLSLRYTSPGGAAQAYTSSSSQYTSTNPLSDVITLHAKATDAAGFVAGTYRIATTATCSQ